MIYKERRRSPGSTTTRGDATAAGAALQLCAIQVVDDEIAAWADRLLNLAAELELPSIDSTHVYRLGPHAE